MENEINGTDALSDAITAPEEQFPGLTPEEHIIALKIMPGIVAKANVVAEAKKAKEISEAIEQLTKQNKEFIDKYVEDLRKQLTPPSTEDINTLLSHDYAEFTVRVGRAGKNEKTFTIRELPLRAELKVLKVIQTTLGKRLKEFAGLQWDPSETTLSKVERMIEMIPGTLEVLAESCAVILDPYNEDKEITQDWILDNINLTTLTTILVAQEKAGRYRDFLSLSSRFIPGAKIQ